MAEKFSPSVVLSYAMNYAVEEGEKRNYDAVSVDLIFMGLLEVSGKESKVKEINDEILRLEKHVQKLRVPSEEFQRRLEKLLPERQDERKEEEQFIRVASAMGGLGEVDAVMMFEAILQVKTDRIRLVLSQAGEANQQEVGEVGHALDLVDILKLQYDAIAKNVASPSNSSFNEMEPPEEKMENENKKVEEVEEVEIADLVRQTKEMREELLKKIQGQDHAVSTFVDGIWNSEIIASSDEKRFRPRGFFVFAGPPGVGKTFLAEEAAKQMRIPFLRLDMSAYADRDGVNDLTGFAKTYKDASKGALTDFVRQNPRCILLFDEIEKAHRNVIHLFLQILDAGVLTELYDGVKVSFKDATIIFTTNAGKGLYEDEDFIDGSAYPQKKILEALEKDVNPLTGEPFFPGAIISRMAAAYTVMFNHLQAHHLEKISEKEFEKTGKQLEKTYNIEITAEQSVYSSLLFSQGGKSDARTLTAKTGAFVRKEIQKLFELFSNEKMRDSVKEIEKIVFSTEFQGAPDEVKKLYENPEVTNILFLGNEKLPDKAVERLSRCEIFYAKEVKEARKLIVDKEIQLVLVQIDSEVEEKKKNDTMMAFDYIPVGAASLSKRRNEIIALHKEEPDLPIYILETDFLKIDRELELALKRDGIRGIVHMEYRKPDEFAEQIEEVSSALYMQKKSGFLKKRSQILHFETAPIVVKNGKEVLIRIRDFSLQQMISVDDAGEELQNAHQISLRFNDVIGADEAKEELRFFVNYLKDPKKFASQGLRPPKGVLLYGDPGTGKTMLAKAMAGEAGVTFLSTEASSFVNKYVGTGPEAVRKLFAKARKYAPSVIFIDEIDTIGRQRTGGEGGRAEESTLTTLLTEMDGFRVDPKRPVFVLAATNYGIEEGDGIGVIDAALARRFDRKIRVSLPDKKARHKFLKLQADKTKMQVSDNMLTHLADRSIGMSLADLTSVIELARRNASRQQTAVTDEILDEAFEVTIYGEKKDWGEKYLERVARHEAGHTVMSWLAGERPSYLTIVARGSHGGYMQKESDSAPINTREELLAKIRTALGGRAAEIVYYGKEDGISTGASGDLGQATAIAKHMICSYGMDDEMGLAVYSEKEAVQGSLGEKIYQKINHILNTELEKTINTLEQSRETIDKLVESLMEKNQLNGSEIAQIMDDKKS